MKSNRIVWIDYLKVIAIYWVVLGHQPITNHNVHDWIFSFHVPVFFFISGYLMKNYKFDWLFVWKNLKKLILVIVPYRAICMILNYAVDLTFYTDQVSITHNLSDPILYFLIGDSRVGPAWFLFVLFWMRITYCCLSQCLEFQYKDFVIFVISLLGPLVVVTFSIEYNYYQIASFMIAFPFFCLGSNLRRYIPTKIEIGKRKSILLSSLLITFSFALLPYAGSINLNDLSWGDNIIIYYFIAMIGIMAMVLLSWTQDKEIIFIRTISDGTIIILLLHMEFIQVFKLLYKKALGINNPPPYMDVLSAIIISVGIILIFYYPIKKIINHPNKYIRFIAGKS